MKAIRIQTESAYDRYAVHMISDFIGYPLSHEGQPDIFYGGTTDGQPRIPKVPDYCRETVPALPNAADFERVGDGRTTFPFDLFKAMEFWLTDRAHDNAPDDAFDQHDRLRYSHSLQAQAGHGTMPIINRYLQLFRHWLSRCFDLKIRTRRARIILTHDVDDPVGPGDLRHSVWLMGAAFIAGRPRAMAGHLRALPRRIIHRLRHPQDEHWNFEKIVQLEAEYDARSAFYFASTPWWWKGASAYDVTYDVRAPAFRHTFRHLHASGAEVGLHMSYHAWKDPRFLSEEKIRLEKASGQPVQGGRHHYWHMAKPFWPTLVAHGQAGLQYDTSIGFNDGAGYRLGFGHPFHPWHPVHASPINVLQIPTVLMDGNLLYDDTKTVDDALESVERILSDLKTSEGTAAIDWHVRTSYPGRRMFTRWADVYRGLLQTVASDSDIEVVTPGEILKARQMNSR